MKQYYVLGRKLSHSLSPFFQNKLFAKGGIQAQYSLLEFEPEIAYRVFSELRESADGFNITVPYKQLCMQYIDEISEEALRADAVNTVVNDNGRLIGYNTDGAGFLKAIGGVAEILKDKQVLLLGAGGAARMLALQLLKCGAQVNIFNRTKENAQALANILNRQNANTRAEVLDQPIKSAFLVVNTTAVGMYPNAGESPLEQKYFEGTSYAFDCVYNPLQTVFLQQAQLAGAHCIDGLSMLWHQGLEAQRLWGNQFSADVLNSVYAQLLEKAGERK